jgi:hypothetical protein
MMVPERQHGIIARLRRTGIGTHLLTALTLLAIGSAGSSCNLDPVHRAGVNSLGPEAADLYPVESEYHRPGEPCSLCHSAKGPASSDFVLGGTIFWGPDNYDARVDNAYVRVLDAEKKQRCFVTNCNGNFYVRRSDFSNITFPLLVSVERAVDPGQIEDTLVIRRMSSHIGRESSCAVCHIQGLRDFASPGQIRMFNSDQEFKDKQIKLVECPPPPDHDQVAFCPEDR